MPVDSVVLQAEFHNFVSYVDLTKTKLESLAEAAKFSEVCESAFPLTNRAFRLLMTAPVTVARDERTFSRPKRIKVENDHDRCTFRIADVVVPREGFNRFSKYGYNFNQMG